MGLWQRVITSKLRCAKSRGSTFEVGEVADSEAIEFLVNSGIDEKQAEDAVARITGGRFALLNEYIIANQRGESNDEILENYNAVTEDVLVDVGLQAMDELFGAVSTRPFKSSEAKTLVKPEQLAQLTTKTSSS